MGVGRKAAHLFRVFQRYVAVWKAGGSIAHANVGGIAVHRNAIKSCDDWGLAALPSCVFWIGDIRADHIVGLPDRRYSCKPHRRSPNYEIFRPDHNCPPTPAFHLRPYKPTNLRPTDSRRPKAPARREHLLRRGKQSPTHRAVVYPAKFRRFAVSRLGRSSSGVAGPKYRFVQAGLVADRGEVSVCV